MNKKLLILLLGTLTATSCGTLTTSGEDIGDNIIKEKTNVTIYHRWNKYILPTIEYYINGFKKIEPNVNINLVSFETYDAIYNTVKQNFATNDYPDIVQGYPDHVVSYQKENYSLNLDTLLKDYPLEDKDDYIESYMDVGSSYLFEGTYSLPFQKSTEVMFYNAEVLHDLNLANIDPTINEGKPLNEKYLTTLTWDELYKKLIPALDIYNNTTPIIDKTGGDYGYLFYESDDNLYITLSEQFGIDYVSYKNNQGSFDFDNYTAKAKMKELNSYAKKGYYTTKGALGKNYYGSSMMKKNEKTQLPKSLFAISSTAGLFYYGQTGVEIGCSVLPQAIANKTTSIFQGPSLTFLANKRDQTPERKNKQLASYLFYRFMTNKENSTYWALNSGYEPIRKSTIETPEYKEFISLEGKVNPSEGYATAIGNVRISEIKDYFTTVAFDGSAAARIQVGGIMTSVTKEKDLTDEKLNKWFQDAMSNCINSIVK